MRTIESQLTIDSDFTGITGENAAPTIDEQDVFALTANLFAHEVLPGTLSSPHYHRW